MSGPYGYRPTHRAAPDASTSPASGAAAQVLSLEIEGHFGEGLPDPAEVDALVRELHDTIWRAL